MESVPDAATQKGGMRVTTRKPATTPLSSKRLRNVGTHICDANGDIGVFSPHHNEPRVYQRSASNRLTPSGGPLNSDRLPHSTRGKKGLRSQHDCQSPNLETLDPYF